MDVPSYAGMGLKARKCRILLSWNLLKEIFLSSFLSSASNGCSTCDFVL